MSNPHEPDPEMAFYEAGAIVVAEAKRIEQYNLAISDATNQIMHGNDREAYRAIRREVDSLDPKPQTLQAFVKFGLIAAGVIAADLFLEAVFGKQDR
jgi:hypothetical protein